MGTEDVYDVAIVGFGPTGVTAANLLGAAGLRVVVIERDGDLFARARAISIDEEVLRIWQRIGLADRIEQDTLAGAAIDFVDERGRSFLSFEPARRGSGYASQHFIFQPALEQVLRDGVDRYPDVAVLLGREVCGLDQDDAGVTLTVLDPAAGTESVLRAAYVIAADGGSGSVRTWLGLGFEGRTYEDRWLVVDTDVLRPWPDHDRLRFHCDPRRPAVDCPTPLGHHRWEFPVLPGEDESELVTLPSVMRLLGRYGVTEENVAVQRAVIYSHHVRFASRWRAGRVFLAGDAAHVMPPWIGQGMCAGVRDAANLCWKIAAVVHGTLPESVLDTYEQERQPHVRAMTKQAVFFGRVICERRRPVAWLRNLAFRGVRHVRGADLHFREARWLPTPSYARGFISPVRHPAVGWLTPQPWVLDESGSRVRFDDALDGRWSLLDLDATRMAARWVQAGAASWRLLPAGSSPAPGALVDVDDVLVSWMRERGARSLVLRPDGHVFTAGGADEDLAPPPGEMCPVLTTDRGVRP